MKEKAGAAFGKKKNWRAKRKEKGAGKRDSGSVWGLQQLAGGSGAVSCPRRGMRVVPWAVRLRGIV